MKIVSGILLSAAVFSFGFGAGVIFTRLQQLPLHQSIEPKAVQNIQHYLNPLTQNKRLISIQQQQRFVSKFKKSYFSPWDKSPKSNAKEAIVAAKKDITDNIARFTAKPGWGMNYHKNSQHWINAITANINLNHFPNHYQRAIITHNTEDRSLPSYSPSYNDPNKAGEGYPFDNLQETSFWTGQPVRVFQRSRDGAWYYVQTASDSGWVTSRDIAFVTNRFIHQYRKSKLVAVTKDNVAIKNTSGDYLFMSRIGTVFPKKNGKVLVPIMTKNHQASLVVADMPASSYSRFPLKPTPKNFALLISELEGEPYGWGGYNHWRDCSLTLKSLYTDFGIFLLRNSPEQINQGKKISLIGLSVKKKLSTIRNNAVPFLTLVGLKGHIMLYIGSKDKKLFVFHNKWGLHTKNIFNNSGRAIIGSAGITSLTFGKNIPFVDNPLIEKVDAITAIAVPKIIEKPIQFGPQRIKLTQAYSQQHYGITKRSIKIIPKMIVLHATETKNWQEAFNAFYPAKIKGRPYLTRYSQLNVSVPYLVARNGTIYHLMPDNWMSRHVIGLNYLAIGIENAGMEKGKYALTAAQVNSDVYLIRILKKKYPSIKYLIGHSEYGKFRHTPLWKEKVKGYFTVKQDPGPEFMKKVRKQTATDTHITDKHQ